MTITHPYKSIESFSGRLAGAICLVLFFLVSMASPGNGQEQTNPEQWLEEAEAAYREVTSYTAVFHKQQRVAGELLQEETVLIKFRKPFSLYMSWTVAPHKGSALLYVDGWNDNRARVHKGGFLGFFNWNLAPTHPRLMKNNLRPLTETGIGFLVKTVGANIRKAIELGELSFTEHGEETVYERKTRRLEIILPKEKTKGCDAYRLIINQDITNKILIKCEVYDWDDHLVESYGYKHLELNASLTDADFDPDNSEYVF